MKNSRNERLSEHLMNVDEEILTNAYEIDDAEKLGQYIKTKNAKTKKPLYMTPLFRRVATIAACFLLVVSAVIVVPMLRDDSGIITPPDVDPGTNNPPISTPDGDLIDSLDILNYYGGILSIKKEQLPINPLVSTASAEHSSSTAFELLNFTYNDNSQIISLSNEAEHQHYDIEQIKDYKVTKSIYFKIVVDETCPFLYQLYGDSIIDVVITKNSIDTIITFQKDKKFYSCLYDQTNDNNNHNTDVFSTKRYIDGSNIVSDPSEKEILFIVNYEYDKTFSKYIENITLEWIDDSNTENSPINIVDFSVISNIEECSISVEEISEYYYNVYNQGLPNGELKYAFKGTVKDSSRIIYIHIFTSGEFYICDERFLNDKSDPFAFYLRGMNSRVSAGHIFLQYTDEKGEDNVVETVTSSNGSFKMNEILFTPYSITENDAANLTVLYFAAYDENGEVIKYLRTNTDGTFIAGEPLYIDPYYDGYINPAKKLIEGYWGINEDGAYFIYYRGNKKITLSGIDYGNGVPLNIKDDNYYLCSDPFPPDEVTDIRKTIDGYELHITRDRHYKIFDKNAVVVEQGTLKYSLDKHSIDFWVEQITGQSTGYLAFVSADESIVYRDYIFYPAQHLIFDPKLSNVSDDFVVRFDIIFTSDKFLSVYIMRDNTFMVWDHLLGYMIYGKGIAIFEDDGIRFKDYVGYDEKPELFAVWTDSATQIEFELEGDVYRLVYDLRIK